MFLEGTNGKNDDLRLIAPTIPNAMNANITTLTATLCFIK